MSNGPVRIQELEVVGYADVVAPDLLPRVVPPIFRFREAPERAVMPPLRLEGPFVIDGRLASAAEVDAAVSRGEVTRLDAAFPALRNHVLWIDEAQQVRYEPAVELADRLRGLARERLCEAEQALADERDDDALRLAQVAICADSKCLGALLVKAFVAEERGRPGVAVLARIAASVDPHYDFRRRLHEFRDGVRRLRFGAREAARMRRQDLGGRPVDDPAASSPSSRSPRS